MSDTATYVLAIIGIVAGVYALGELLALAIKGLMRYRRQPMAFYVEHPPHRDRNTVTVAEWRRKKAALRAARSYRIIARRS